MGKQVNFYMTPDDEQEFLRFVRSDRNVGVFKYAVSSDQIPLLDELPNQGDPFWGALFLWDRDHSPSPITTFVKKQNYYVVNFIESEVVEFSRSHFDEGRLVRGRIWAEMNYWRLSDNPPSVVKKSAAFVKWFDRLTHWIKQCSTRNSVNDYMLPGAAAFAARGGELCQAVLASGEAL